MADSKGPKVITVKDTSLVAMTKACEGNAQSARRLANTGDAAWGSTTLWIEENIGFDSFDAAKEVKDIAEDIRTAYKDAFLIKYADAVDEGLKDELTTESIGKNHRTGKMMEILDKDGVVKWSSWSETRLAINYCGDLATVVKAELVDELLVAKNKVIGKSDILKMSKPKPSVLSAIIQAIENADKKFEELSNEDKQLALASLDEAYVKWDGAVAATKEAKAA